ncbi:unnamed protein product [Euphydryas editha]|uniref:Uncharacterized protein n=1 Tax=Euphydryas editha TaxID=104508 RepID=A0AAU9TEZ9_EUPED|nr:unnamed protein product [Euphydryas editha]
MAAQPPRPPPNNLLFNGPPPSLPRVLLVPSDASKDYAKTDAVFDVVLDQNNDTDNLGEINNVGVPTYDELFSDQAEKHVYEKDPVKDQQCHAFNFLRRARSFDISDMYVISNKNIDDQAFSHRQSEPDLSKYRLYVEAEISVQPLQPPPLVLNNPFYDGSYALASSDLNENIVMLPENYLAFEDSFVPSWEYKPEYILNQEVNPALYYDGLPLIPPNDPWSTYGSTNTEFEYYSPQFVIPTEEGAQYMRLSDYAIPQYMSLPMIEQAPISLSNMNNKESEIANKLSSSSDNLKNPPINANPPASSVGITQLNEEDKMCAKESTVNRDSSKSEESFNADISNDVTSSLAFIPSSKSSQRLCGTDDTSDDTSPCSTDYHEASALDLAQSLDELSCDSTDFSQSRDEPFSEHENRPNEIKPNSSYVDKNECNGPSLLESNKPLTNVSLSQLSSIPFQRQEPTEPSSMPKDFEKNKNVNKINTSTNTETVVASGGHVPSNSVKSTQSASNNNKVLKPVTPVKPVNNVDSAIFTTGIKQHPQPPAVPPSWLTKAPTDNHVKTTTQELPEILIHNTEGETDNHGKSSTLSANHSVIVNKPALEPQPSCSYAPPVPPQPSHLRPDKQPKEVEVS